MPVTQPSNPFLGFWFSVTIPNIATAAFAEATLADISVATANYREGTDDLGVRTLSGLVSYGDVKLSKGLTSSLDLYKWVSSVVEKGGANVRRNVSIALTDGKKTLANWNLIGAMPIGYQTSTMNAANTEVVIETLVLNIGRMERTL